MNKSKISTIFILLFLFGYCLFSQVYLLKFSTIYTFIINPLFFSLVAIMLKFFTITPKKKMKFKTNIIRYIIITILSYILVYFLSGTLTGFGKNPYILTFKGIIQNMYAVGFILLCQEYIRYKLINNVFKTDRNLIFILIVIVFTMFDIKILTFFNGDNSYFLLKNIFSTVIPSLAKNVLLTYIVLYTDYKCSFLYAISMYIMLWIPPILPNSPWILIAIIDTLFPLILYLYCKYCVYKMDRFHLNSVKPFDPKGMIPLSSGVVLVIWFALGIFPIKPVGVASRQYGAKNSCWRYGNN